MKFNKANKPHEIDDENEDEPIPYFSSVDEEIKEILNYENNMVFEIIQMRPIQLDNHEFYNLDKEDEEEVPHVGIFQKCV
ncbi:hypothetical protein BpHYR1_013564 [Brachionus plicatilis]|uniref:Uncharacterized protein n=1 Tax=Brachionus plicatilis TaxID=10195 RepID=A0A3M7QKV4_BRAPC|nr:hypothetical protein BpHYR1_013564 [Brachionus plicatilis]